MTLDEQAAELLSKLSASVRRDDAAVAVALRAGRHADGRWYANLAENGVGDTYAMHGRIRSQGISRARRRGIALDLFVEHRYRFDLTPLGRAVARLLAAEVNRG